MTSFDPNTGLPLPVTNDPNARSEAFRPDPEGGRVQVGTDNRGDFTGTVNDPPGRGSILAGKLPQPELLAAPTIPAGPNQLIVAPMPAAPTPGVVPTDEQEFLQRVANALNRLNIDPNQVKVGILHQLEAAAAAYQSVPVGNDKNFWQAQAVRLTAALHALI